MRHRERAHVRMFLRDVFGQAMVEALGRPGRTLLTVLGTILGVGMFVATLGVTNTARAQINQDFDVLVSTEVVIQDAHPDDRVFALTSAGERRARTLNGVTAVGLLGKLKDDAAVSRLPTGGAFLDAEAEQDQTQLFFADVGALGVVRPTVRGRPFDATQLRRSAEVVLVGSNAADQLGIAARDLPTSLYIGGNRFLVEGIIDRVERHAELLNAVVMPQSTAAKTFGSNAVDQADMVIATRFGYATEIGRVLAATVSPVDPDRVAVITPPDPSGLRAQVTDDLSGLFAILGGVGLLVGMIGIGNTTLLSVLERVQEIGLRRAIGARRGQIAGQFLLESLILGTVGGVLGACGGVITVTAVALEKDWAPTIPAWLPLLAPLLGTLTGLVAGSYPAARAARIDPATALR